MRRGWRWEVLVGVLFAAGVPAGAAEHGGQEHGGAMTAPKEHGGAAAVSQPAEAVPEHAGRYTEAEPSAEDLRTAIRTYIGQVEERDGTFTIEDEVTGQTRTLTLVGVHERVGKTGNYYYSCTDMRDTGSKELLDLDFDVEAEDGVLDVVDVRIHKVSGKARYTYDEHDNRIPL